MNVDIVVMCYECEGLQLIVLVMNFMQVVQFYCCYICDMLFGMLQVVVSQVDVCSCVDEVFDVWVVVNVFYGDELDVVCVYVDICV